MEGLDKWDFRFLKIAKEVSLWSKDTRTKVGAVLVRDRRVLATGYNGSAAGIDDFDYENPEEKRAHVIHAEENAIINAARGGDGTVGATLYCTHQPCSLCASRLVNAGVTKVVALRDGTLDLRTWGFSIRRGAQIFKTAGVEYLVTVGAEL